MKSLQIGPHIIPFSEKSAIQTKEIFDLAGGKGANLLRLVSAGLPVPQGFILTTNAYCEFIALNSIESAILKKLPVGSGQDLQVLEEASKKIRRLFSTVNIPAVIAAQIINAYTQLGSPPVAVRSSATTEDLPGLSFAGQQDTFLNIVDEKSLLKAVVDCWSSLWTARAIGYRNRNGISHAGISLAVVVQQMIQSESSGVLFTANPLTGLRSEAVIDATFGLGEALVSGQVEPDHYVVDLAAGKIISKTLGRKEVAIRGNPEGGTFQENKDHEIEQALNDNRILQLSRLGKQVESLDGVSQDIEWAFTDNDLHLLQSRPITTLYPIPEGMSPDPLDVMFSFGAVQGMLDPITPLGQDAMKIIFAIGSSLMRIQVTAETQRVLFTAGERLWARFTPLVRNTVGRKIQKIAFQFVEPTVLQAVLGLLDDPRLQPKRKGLRPKAIFQIANFAVPLAGNIFLNILHPDARRKMIQQNAETLIETVREEMSEIQGDRYARLGAQAAYLEKFAGKKLPKTFLLFISGVASGMASFNFLYKTTDRLPDRLDGEDKPSRADLLMEVTRGLPYNPTTSMDLDLWKIARVIQSDPLSKSLFEVRTPQELAAIYVKHELPPVSQEAVAAFLKTYGLRGFGEIDLGRPRWNDDPTHIFESLRGYLQIVDESRAPDIVFKRSAGDAQKAIDRLAAEVRSRPYGWIKSRLVRFFAGRARSLMGLRESPKFFAVRLMGQIRQCLIETAKLFVESGELDRVDDVVYLSFLELQRFVSREEQDWKALIQTRRTAYQSEFRRKQIPRVLLSDGRAFYEGMQDLDASADKLIGSPVSPGVVEGRVRVVLDPRSANLQPGEILVCPGTDPSWTPLFLTAGGLIMEVGGMMTHGAVVAREYGIPAAVGVHEATTRLKTGMCIRLDGSSGQIVII